MSDEQYYFSTLKYCLDGGDLQKAAAHIQSWLQSDGPTPILHLRKCFVAAAQKNNLSMLKLLDPHILDPSTRQNALLCALENHHLGCIHHLRHAVFVSRPAPALHAAKSANVAKLLLGTLPPSPEMNNQINMCLTQEIQHSRVWMVQVLADRLKEHVSTTNLIKSVVDGRIKCMEHLYHHVPLPGRKHALAQILKNKKWRDPDVVALFQARVQKDTMLQNLQKEAGPPAPASPKTRRKI